MSRILCLLFFQLLSLLSFSQGDYEGNYEKAKTEEKVKDFTHAIIDYTAAINADSSHIEAYYYRGIANLRLSSFKDAIKDFSVLIELKRNTIKDKNLLKTAEGKYFANSYFYRAEAEFQLDHYEHAVIDYSIAIRDKIDSIGDAYNGRGRAKKRLADYYRSGDYFDAISDFNKGIRLAPHKAFGYYHRGTAEFNGQYFQASVKDITKAVQLDTLDADKYYWLAMAQSRLKNYPGAIKNFTKSISLNPDKIREYEGRASAEMAMGLTDAAEADTKKLKELYSRMKTPYKFAPEPK